MRQARLGPRGSLNGLRQQYLESVVPPRSAESIRDAKGWISRRMPSGCSYRPTLDQAALATVLDLAAAVPPPPWTSCGGRSWDG